MEPIADELITGIRQAQAKTAGLVLQFLVALVVIGAAYWWIHRPTKPL